MEFYEQYICTEKDREEEREKDEEIRLFYMRVCMYACMHAYVM